MSYKPEQLPFIEYQDWVHGIKKAHDMQGGGYPLYIEVFDKDGQKIIEQVFTNVYNHKSEPTNVAVDEWLPPLSAQIFESRNSTERSVPIEMEIHVPNCAPSDQMSVFSILYTDEEAIQHAADLKKIRRQAAADTKRLEKELRTQIDKKK
jgi:hypothetical protein